MLKVGVVLGSSRPNRVGAAVAPWVMEQAGKRDDAEFTLIDLKEVNLPLLDEGLPPMANQLQNQHSKDWAATVAQCDAFVFITPEYNHSFPAVLKNALDYVFYPWNNKAAGFVSYGVAGGLRAVEQLRPVMAELQMATTRTQLSLLSYVDFENFHDFKPTDQHVQTLSKVFDEVIAWGTALKPLRHP